MESILARQLSSAIIAKNAAAICELIDAHPEWLRDKLFHENKSNIFIKIPSLLEEGDVGMIVPILQGLERHYGLNAVRTELVFPYLETKTVLVWLLTEGDVTTLNFLVEVVARILTQPDPKLLSAISTSLKYFCIYGSNYTQDFYSRLCIILRMIVQHTGADGLIVALNYDRLIVPLLNRNCYHHGLFLHWLGAPLIEFPGYPIIYGATPTEAAMHVLALDGSLSVPDNHIQKINDSTRLAIRNEVYFSRSLTFRLIFFILKNSQKVNGLGIISSVINR